MAEKEQVSTVTSTLGVPEGFEFGKSIEHILLSITVVSTNRICQYDDTCAGIIWRTLKEYGGVQAVNAEVLYKHTKIETHPAGCDCHYCTMRNFEAP